jgi:hypothetical protein
VIILAPMVTDPGLSFRAQSANDGTRRPRLQFPGGAIFISVAQRSVVPVRASMDAKAIIVEAVKRPPADRIAHASDFHSTILRAGHRAAGENRGGCQMSGRRLVTNRRH